MIIPVFRIFHYDKALEFYLGWLGFTLDWEHREPNIPVYMQVSLGQGIVLHLSEHHGDGTPGSKAIAAYEGLREYHATLIAKNYTYMRPGLERVPWNENAITMEVTDPFMNRIVFEDVIEKQ